MNSKAIGGIVVVGAILFLSIIILTFTSDNSEMSDETTTQNDTSVAADENTAINNNDSINQDTVDAQNPSGATFNSNEEKYNFYDEVPATLSSEAMTGKKSIITTSKGVIEIELFGDDAPIATSNHIFLANEGFYDSLIFHRREEGFVIQGGDPLGQGFGGPGYQFEDEPVTRSYDRGIVAMANSGPDTNGSQFFIMLDDVDLPPLYTIFGKVTSGIEVVDEIAIGDEMISVEIK